MSTFAPQHRDGLRIGREFAAVGDILAGLAEILAGLAELRGYDLREYDEIETCLEREKRALEQVYARQERGLDVDRTAEEFLVEWQRAIDLLTELRTRLNKTPGE